MKEQRDFLDICAAADRRRVEMEGGAHRAFIEPDNWNITTIDKNDKDGWDFEPDIEADIMDLTVEDLPHTDYDVVWASPPCPDFSMASVGNNWGEGRMPTGESVAYSVALTYRALYFIGNIRPRWWFIENPVGMMPYIMPTHPREDERMPWTDPELVTYCQYGHDSMKRTLLFGRHPPSFDYRRCSEGDPCHETAVRGFDTGTQGKGDGVVRSIVPSGVSEAVLKSVENPGPVERQRKLVEMDRTSGEGGGTD